VLVSVLRQGDFLIAAIHSALDDGEMTRFQNDVLRKISEGRSRGIIIDVGAVDVLDSFGTRTIRNLAHMARLRGAVTIIVGIRPDVAFAIVQLGMDIDVHTALDLEEGLLALETLTSGSRDGGSTLGFLRDDIRPNDETTKRRNGN
jgi:rsbT antagonist protein RsbS